MTNTTNKREGRRGLPFMMSVGAAFIVLWPVPFILLSQVVHAGAAIVVGAISGFAFGVLVLHRVAPGLYPAVWLMLVSMGLGGYFGQDYLALVCAETAAIASPSETPGHEDADLFRFAEVRVAVESIGWTAGAAVVGHEEQRSFLAAAPVVGPKWQAGAPISAWALCGTTSRYLGTEDWRQWVVDNCVPGWQSGEGAWRRTSAESEPAHRQAVEAIAKSEGLPFQPNAVLLEWVANPEQDIAEAQEATVSTLLACGAAWMFFLPLALRISARRRRKRK